MQVAGRLKLIGSIVLTLAVGGVGSLIVADAIPTWYASLEKPFFAPPTWIFGPVWTVLYVLMGIALYLIWKTKDGKKRKTALTIFFLQLILNALWSPVFFGLKDMWLAFVIIVILLVMIIQTYKSFHAIDRRAAILLVPYLLWVSFASVLNFAFALLN